MNWRHACMILLLLGTAGPARAQEPSTAEDYFKRAKDRYQNSKYQDALNDMNRAIELSPGDANYLTGRGQVWYHLSDNDKAIADFNRALDIDPNSLVALNARGIAEDAKQDYAAAVRDYSLAIQLAPNNSTLY